jgi:hypothetical protein
MRSHALATAGQPGAKRAKLRKKRRHAASIRLDHPALPAMVLPPHLPSRRPPRPLPPPAFGDDDVFSVYAPKPPWRRWRTHLRTQDERERLRWRALAPIFRYGGRG